MQQILDLAAFAEKLADGAYVDQCRMTDIFRAWQKMDALPWHQLSDYQVRVGVRTHKTLTGFHPGHSPV